MNSKTTRNRFMAYSLSGVATCFFLLGCNNKKETASSEPVFKRIPSQQSGITFANQVDENYDKNYFDRFAYVYNGAGVAVGDINNDGLQDIYFTGNEVPNKLYLNLGGMKFKDITESAGVDGGKGWDNGVTMVDINNDGLLDIYVCNDGYEDIFVSNDYADNDYIFINQKNGTFKDEVKSMTNHLSLFSMGADIADINNDGYEDIYVTEMLSEDYKRSKVSMPRMDVEG